MYKLLCQQKLFCPSPFQKMFLPLSAMARGTIAAANVITYLANSCFGIFLYCHLWFPSIHAFVRCLLENFSLLLVHSSQAETVSFGKKWSCFEITSIDRVRIIIRKICFGSYNLNSDNMQSEIAASSSLWVHEKRHLPIQTLPLHDSYVRWTSHFSFFH